MTSSWLNFVTERGSVTDLSLTLSYWLYIIVLTLYTSPFTHITSYIIHMYCTCAMTMESLVLRLIEARSFTFLRIVNSLPHSSLLSFEVVQSYDRMVDNPEAVRCEQPAAIPTPPARNSRRSGRHQWVRPFQLLRGVEGLPGNSPTGARGSSEN